MTPDERAAFLAERLTGLGGSDAKHVMSIQGEWRGMGGCLRRLFYEKRGQAPDFPVDETGVIERGNVLEPIVAAIYQRRTRRRTGPLYESQDAYRRAGSGELLVHIDRSVYDADESRPGVLEIKTANREIFHRIKKNGLPVAYILQMQWALMVTGWSWGSFAVFWPDGWELIHFDVERDDKICDHLESQGQIVWARIQNGPIYEPLDPQDPRCAACPFRRTCQGNAILEQMIPEKDRKLEEYDASLAGLVREYLDAKQLEAEAEALVQEKREPLEKALGARQLVPTAGAVIHYKPQAGRQTATVKTVEQLRRSLVRQAMSTIAAFHGISDEEAALLWGFIGSILAANDVGRATPTRPLRIYEV